MTPWRAFYCRSSEELRARDELRALGIEVFCPFERFKRHLKRRGVTIGVFWADVPLFPNYLFARTNSFARLELVRGLGSPIKTSAGPLAVPERVILRMQSLCGPDGLAFKADLTKNSFWFRGRVGDSVQFKPKSPLAGLLARISSISRLDESGTLEAWVELFGQETQVSFPYSEVNLAPAEL